MRERLCMRIPGWRGCKWSAYFEALIVGGIELRYDVTRDIMSYVLWLEKKSQQVLHWL